MKTWFAKFRCSCALDEARTTPPAAKKADQFESQLRELDSELRGGVTKAQVPANLHQSIMRSVRAAGRQAPVAAYPSPLAFAALAASIVLATAVMYRVGAWDSAPKENSLAVATSTLDSGAQMAREVPATALAPLSDELARLDRDVAHATEFLLGSLP